MLIDDIKLDEGFNGNPYPDPIKSREYPEFAEMYNEILRYLRLTIGYGCLLPLSKKEAEILLIHRLDKIRLELSKKQTIFINLPEPIQEILLNMGYNMGVPTLLKFKKMWKALGNRDYIEASNQMIDSLWFRQNTDRAKRLADKMREIK